MTFLADKWTPVKKLCQKSKPDMLGALFVLTEIYGACLTQVQKA